MVLDSVVATYEARNGWSVVFFLSVCAAKYMFAPYIVTIGLVFVASRVSPANM